MHIAFLTTEYPILGMKCGGIGIFIKHLSHLIVKSAQGKEYRRVAQHSYRICHRPAIKQSRNQACGNKHAGNRPASSPSANVAVQSN